MKVGGGLNYVTGPMGSGKSLFGVRRISDALFAGQYVITNIELLPGWAELLARKAAATLRFRSDKRQKVIDKFRGLYVFETSLEVAMRYRVPGRGESRALFMWDETHNDLNNRDWRKDGRDEILRWGTQLRKLGFVGFLLSQHQQNTDAALRRICNFEVRLQNQREQHRVMGMRVRFIPPLFIAAWYPAHLIGGGKVLPYKTERYLLSWHKRLYDSWGLFHGLDGDPDSETSPILLPETGRRPGEVVAALAARPAEPRRCILGCHELPDGAQFDPHTGAPIGAAKFDPRTGVALA